MSASPNSGLTEIVCARGLQKAGLFVVSPGKNSIGGAQTRERELLKEEPDSAAIQRMGQS
jgi:hypothetical protein